MVIGVLCALQPAEATYPDTCHPFCDPPVWRADDITCFDVCASGWQGAQSVPGFRHDLRMLAPRLIAGRKISRDMFEGIAIFPYVSVMNLLINVDGRVEMIFALPFDAENWGEEHEEPACEIEGRLVDAYRSWRFEPATDDGKPLCTWLSVIASPRGLLMSTPGWSFTEDSSVLTSEPKCRDKERFGEWVGRNDDCDDSIRSMTDEQFNQLVAAMSLQIRELRKVSALDDAGELQDRLDHYRRVRSGRHAPESP